MHHVRSRSVIVEVMSYCDQGEISGIRPAVGAAW